MLVVTHDQSRDACGANELQLTARAAKSEATEVRGLLVDRGGVPLEDAVVPTEGTADQEGQPERGNRLAVVPVDRGDQGIDEQAYRYM